MGSDWFGCLLPWEYLIAPKAVCTASGVVYCPWLSSHTPLLPPQKTDGKERSPIGKQQRMGQGSRTITNDNKGFLSQVLYDICSKMRNTAPKSIKYRRYS